MPPSPRPSPYGATPTSPTHSPREPPPTRSRSSVDLASYTERAGGDGSGAAMAGRGSEGTASTGSNAERENTKLNQIIQHFHTKAALMICSARASLPVVENRDGGVKQNRWFNIVLDDTDVLFDDLHEWKRPDLYEDRPPPMTIEVFVDTSHLSHNQALVHVDDSGKRWDVADALTSQSGSRNGGKHCEVVLERWLVELGSMEGYPPAELNDALPNVYKKGVVLFRSLYTFLRFMPAWKLYRKLGRQSGNTHGLKLKFRIKTGYGLAPGQKDSLFTPLCPAQRDSEQLVEHHDFQPLVTRVGPLHCSLDYRTHCGFAVADSESLLSSRFLGLDEGMSAIPVGRSLPGGRTEQPRDKYSSTAVPTATSRERPRGLLGAYGSLGTYHAAEKRTSPVSELKQRALEDDSEDNMSRVDRLREEEGLPRRTSSDGPEIWPFKSPSMNSSSRPSPSPGTSAGKSGSLLEKYGGTSASSSKRTSLNTLPQQQLRAPPIPNEAAIASSGSASPKPAPVRYSSSFANRPRRFTSQSSKTGESAGSSGRGSSSSKEKSGPLPEPSASTGIGTGPGTTTTSSTSARTDEEDIAAFISDLEKTSKDLSLPRASPTTSSPQQPPSPHTVNLAKYSSLRDPSTQLAEEMSASSLVHATPPPASAPTPPSRRLSNVPGLSTSSSPSRALAHAPHVRSRLSTHSIAEESSAAADGNGNGAAGSPRIAEEGDGDVDGGGVGEGDGEDDEPFIFPHDMNL